MGTSESPVHEEPSRIPVAYVIIGYENNRNAIINFYRNSTSMVNLVTNAAHPEIAEKVDWLHKEVSAARERGVICKTITEITKSNLQHCKKIKSRIDELRHLDGIQVIFGVSDTEALAMAPSLGPRQERNIQFIQSDSESVVAYKQLIFDTLWIRATPAQSRFDELEGKKAASAFGEKGSVKAAIEARKKVIDRIYVCKDCHQDFIYASEVDDHKKTEGHEHFREYPLV
jgi:hypothetical protein